MDINTKATFFSIQELLPFMKSNGGSIVLIGSSQADRGQADRTAYAMSKGALITLNKHISKHFGKYKIRCNNLVMGWTLTENELKLRKSLGQTEKDIKEIAKNYIPLGRLTRIDDIFPSILFLLSDYSSMVTGSTINVNGGEII
jgi:NAD(P)-dependent dehydrogenase (short-subunit alcohol dehydrogenase family)